MDYQEALETKTRMCNICREDGKPTEAACNNCSDKIAIYALSKQIGQEPILVEGYPETFHICPDCGSTFIEREKYRMKYCNNCGQAIDWRNAK